MMARKPDKQSERGTYGSRESHAEEKEEDHDNQQADVCDNRKRLVRIEEEIVIVPAVQIPAGNTKQKEARSSHEIVRVQS